MTCHDSRSDPIDAEFNGSWSVLRSVWISHPKQLQYINVQNNKNPGFYHHFVSSFFRKHLSLGIQPPKLRMVSWKLNTMRFGGDEGHPKVIIWRPVIGSPPVGSFVLTGPEGWQKNRSPMTCFRSPHQLRWNPVFNPGGNAVMER